MDTQPVQIITIFIKMEILKNLGKIKKDLIRLFVIADAREKRNKDSISNIVFNKVEENGLNTKPEKKNC